MRYLLCCFATAVLAGCADSSAPRRDAFELSGTVTDADGDPLAGVAVVLDYDFAEAVPTTADKPSTRITFSIPEAGAFRLIITDACDAETFYDTGDSTVEAGNHEVVWDGTDLAGKQVPEGVYAARLELAERDPVVHMLGMAYNVGSEAGSFGGDAQDIRDSWRLDDVTDAAGRFSLERACWDFGRRVVHTDEEGTVIGSLTVATQVRLWFYAEGAARGVPGPWTEIDPDRGAVLDFAFPRD